jgi:hypothetical protein
MQFNLQDIVHQHNNLEHLCIPFTNEEIDNVILELPYDKALGPVWFNNLFLKKSWPIIRGDFYKLCHDFYHHQADLKSINHSYVTLVPKKDKPKRVHDFRPISLLNSSPKLVSKLLANRLQTVAIDIVHVNQYGFIKGKTIQDCLGWAFEFLYQCHQSRQEIVILKLDFKKAFDLIEHSALFAMLHAKGFPNKWICWIKVFFQLPLLLCFSMALLGRISSAREVSDRVILSLHSFLQLLLIFFNVSSIENTRLATFCALSLKGLSTPSPSFSMLMTLS